MAKPSKMIFKPRGTIEVVNTAVHILWDVTCTCHHMNSYMKTNPNENKLYSLLIWMKNYSLYKHTNLRTRLSVCVNRYGYTEFSLHSPTDTS